MSNEQNSPIPDEKTSKPAKAQKQDAGKVFIEEVTAPPAKSGPRWKRMIQSAAIPLLAILTGMILGGIIIILTSETVWAAFQESFLAGLKASWQAVATAYGALFVGAFGRPSEIWAAIVSGDAQAFYMAIYPFTESLMAATPYIFAGLSVALAFRAGLFNIGAEGQLFLGAIFAAFVGYSLKGLPLIIHFRWRSWLERWEAAFGA